MSLDTPLVQNDSVRTSILEVARELFAKFGYKKTTMEDIAQALGKGKSSLYYYFKNKEEIFQAVLDWESEIMFSKLRTVVASNIQAHDKMKRYVEVRMETLRELENYHKALKDESMMVFDFLEIIKGKSEKEETSMIKQMLDEGVGSGLFQVKNSQLAAIAISTALKGLEMPLFRMSAPKNLDDFKSQLNNILNILFYGLMKR
ncbi:MAG: TetR/AcrR family transcriptional regulator [Breznakibacter sp.]